MSLVVWLPLVSLVKNLGLSGATISTSSLSYTLGAYGSSASFNGNHIKIENLPTFTNGISIAFCMKPTNTSQTGCLINYRMSTGGDLGVFLMSGKIRFDLGGAMTSFNYSFTTGWLHVLITYDKLNKKLYVNGELKQTVACTGNINITATKGTIGQSSTNTTNGDGNNYVGLLNDYRIYDHCLSDLEIYLNQLGLVAHYKLGSEISNGSSGVISNVWDSSGNGHNATLTGGSLNSDSARNERCLLVSSSSYVSNSTSKLGGAFNTGIYTVSLACKLTNPTSTYNCVLSVGEPSTANKGFNIQVNSTSVYVVHENSNNGMTGTISNTNQWKLITVTNDGTTTKLYVNGTLVTSKALGVPNIAASVAFSIGRMVNATLPTTGYISDVRIYSSCFTAAQVLDTYKTREYIDNKANVGCYEYVEDITKTNIIAHTNIDIANETWNTSYLGRYTLTNLSVTTDNGIVKILRTGNLTGSGSANLDYGGIIIRNTNNILNLAKNHTYVFVCDIKGYTCTMLSNPSWVHTPGWNYNDGTVPTPTNQLFRNPIVAGYNNDNWNQLSYKFTINDDIYKVSTGLSGGHTAGLTYLSYFGLMVGFLRYTTTTTGAELYIKNIRLFDITDSLLMVSMKSNGVILCNQAVENGNNAFISCNGDISGKDLIEI